MNTSAPSHFFEAAAFPFLPALAARLDAIRDEARETMARFNYLRWRYPSWWALQNPGMTGARGTFYLEMYGTKLGRNRALCPASAAAVDAVPNLVTAAIYLLDAHSRILPHTGATDSVVRGHMGLICPKGCGLRVGTEVREWTEGGFLLFDDSVDHEAWNDSDTMRAILLFDFFKEPHDAGRRLQDLRNRYLTPADQALILAADPEDDPQVLDRMRTVAAGVQRVGPLPMADMAPIIRESGLYFS